MFRKYCIELFFLVPPKGHEAPIFWHLWKFSICQIPFPYKQISFKRTPMFQLTVPKKIAARRRLRSFPDLVSEDVEANSQLKSCFIV